MGNLSTSLKAGDTVEGEDTVGVHSVTTETSNATSGTGSVSEADAVSNAAVTLQRLTPACARRVEHAANTLA